MAREWPRAATATSSREPMPSCARRRCGSTRWGRQAASSRVSTMPPRRRHRRRPGPWRRPRRPIHRQRATDGSAADRGRYRRRGGPAVRQRPSRTAAASRLRPAARVPAEPSPEPELAQQRCSRSAARGDAPTQRRRHRRRSRRRRPHRRPTAFNAGGTGPGGDCGDDATALVCAWQPRRTARPRPSWSPGWARSA